MINDPESTYTKRSKKWKLKLLSLVIALITVIIICINIGYAPLPFTEIIAVLGNQIPFLNNLIDPNSFSTTTQSIIIFGRLPRIMVAVILGAGLAASGVLYQGVFRNPMADPFVLGVSSGASVGAGLGIIFWSGLSILGFSIIPIAAFVGALVTVFVVYKISKVGSRLPEMTLLLSGLAITFFLSAVFQAMQVTATGTELPRLVHWNIGDIKNVTWGNCWSIFPFIIVGIIISYFFSRSLNMMALGEDTAQHLGVNTEKTKKILIVLGALMTGAAVSISGLIGFVGLMIPHITRIIIGPDHRILLPASVVVGAIFLVICDAIARVATGVAEWPVGIITACAGGPFFIFLLRKKKMSYRM